MPDQSNEIALHPEATTQARRALRKALSDVTACGESGYAFGWWLETHTVGCASPAIPAEQKLDILYALYLQYVNDGISVVMGDPGEGAFVSATPYAAIKHQMGASDLIELGRRGGAGRRGKRPARNKKRRV